MSEHAATLRWQRGEEAFTDSKYNRAHQWEFDGGLTVPASASPHVVPLPYSNPANVDPEEAFVASLSSCHMLFFLSLAAQRGYRVDSYVDQATGHMGKDVDGCTAMVRVILRPAARYSGERIPTREQVEALHHRSHELCFIANSVKTEVVTEIVS
jgi:organic hydroperoxide reductase OsmC/OhrA